MGRAPLTRPTTCHCAVKRINQARLSNPRPHDKDDLPLSASRLLEMGVELVQHGLGGPPGLRAVVMTS